MILTADRKGIVCSDSAADRVPWKNVLCIFGVRLRDDANRFHLFFDIYDSGIKRLDISETHDGFRDVIFAVDQHIHVVVPADHRLTIDWDRLVSTAVPNERLFIWWADQYCPGRWPPEHGEPLGDVLVDSPFFRERDVFDPDDQSEFDLPYYDWLDARAKTELTADSPQDFTTFEILYWLQSEILNGGLDQYFTNSSSDRANDAVEALRRISAVEAADSLDSAIALAFGGICPTELHERQRLLENAGDVVLDHLSRLDLLVATGWLGLLHDHLSKQTDASGSE